MPYRSAHAESGGPSMLCSASL